MFFKKKCFKEEFILTTVIEITPDAVKLQQVDNNYIHTVNKKILIFLTNLQLNDYILITEKHYPHKIEYHFKDGKKYKKFLDDSKKEYENSIKEWNKILKTDWANLKKDWNNIKMDFDKVGEDFGKVGEDFGKAMKEMQNEINKNMPKL